jgi:hypothetical protein
MPNANVDLIGQGGQLTGEVANYVASQGRLDPGRMRPFLHTNGKSYCTVYAGGNPADASSYKTIEVNAGSTLRRDEWKTLDDAVMMVSRSRLGGIDDLISKGLTYNLGNAMGTTVLEWHDVSDGMEADLTMDGVTRGIGDRVVYQHNYLPIPIIHVDYEINARVLAASRSMSNPLDTTAAERATRKINEKLEAMLFTNTSYSFGEKDSRTRNTIYSYVNHPDRNLKTLTKAWTDSSKTGKQIVDEVIAMKQKSIDNLHFGPWMLYIPTAYETQLDEDYVGSTPDTAPNTTIRARLLAISGIQGIKVVDTLPANNVLLVQMTSDVVRLIRGMGIQNVEWSTEGKMITKYKVMTIQVPQIRSDMNGKSGIVHLA